MRPCQKECVSRLRPIRNYETYQELGLRDYLEDEPASPSEEQDRQEHIRRLTAAFRAAKGHVPVDDSAERRLRARQYDVQDEFAEVL